MDGQQKNLIRRKAYAFKKYWLNLKGKEATPKILVYYRRGLKRRIEESRDQYPGLVGERFFLPAVKIDRKNFPTPDDIDDCFSAFMKGFNTDPKSNIGSNLIKNQKSSAAVAGLFTYFK